MSNYPQRDTYFEMLASNNKLIAHERPVSDGSSKLRKSYFRINDLDELNAACVNWAHSPCMVHVGHDILFKQPGSGLPRKMIGNHLYFLSKTKGQNLADEMLKAYSESEETMSQVLSWMNEEMEENQRCGNLFLFDLKGAHAEQVGPFNDVLYGWHLTFYDETTACELGYHNDDWFAPLEDGQDTDCGCNDCNGLSNGYAEIIFFDDQSSVDIEMTQDRILKLGQMPQIQVWFQDDNDETIYNKANVPIKTNGAPPNVLIITVSNTGNASGFITLTKTIAAAGQTNNSCAEIIFFDDQLSVDIDMTDATRKAKLGQMPQVQVWFQDDNDETIYNKANVPINTNGAPPNVTSITVLNTGAANGFITLKKTV